MIWNSRLPSKKRINLFSFLIDSFRLNFPTVAFICPRASIVHVHTDVSFCTFFPFPTCWVLVISTAQDVLLMGVNYGGKRNKWNFVTGMTIISLILGMGLGSTVMLPSFWCLEMTLFKPRTLRVPIQISIEMKSGEVPATVSLEAVGSHCISI